MSRLTIRRQITLLSAGAALPGPLLADASGFALLEQSASRLGTAFSGTGVAADDATTVYFNPAGMSYLKDADALVLASGIEITSEFSDANSTAALGQPLGNSGGDAGDWNFVPGAYVAAPLTDRLAVGIGVNAPFGLKLVYEDGWIGRFQALRSEITTINVNPSVSYRISDRLSLGAGIVAAASTTGGALSSGPVSVDLKLPDCGLLSLRQMLGDRLELLADVGWTGWSSVQELRIVRNSGSTVSVTPERWMDVWRYALGATYSLTNEFSLRAGVAYDETPVPDATRTPRLPDTNRTWLAVGARWGPAPSIIVDLGYAHLFSDTVPLHQNAGNAAASGLLAGEQHSDIDIVSTQILYRF